jgi:uncharacterized protein YgbK (DUF1537 family)
MGVERAPAIRRLTRAATRRLRAFDPIVTFKKIDSTLRGHLRIELDAVRSELPTRLAIVCPAFPANGRTVRAGMLCVGGQARGSVRTAFGMEDDPLARDLDREALQTVSHRLPDLLQQWRGESVHSVFCDAEDDSDLDLVASAILQCADACLPVGSAGLAGAIARGAEPAARAAETANGALQELAAGPVVVFVGSLHDAARRQAALLTERSGTAPVVIRSVRASADVAREVVRRFNSGSRVVLVTTPGEPLTPYDPSLELWLYKGFIEVSGLLPRFGLVMTGGDTAERILSAIAGCDGLAVLGEVEPGVVVGRLKGSGRFGAAVHGLPVVLKAGAFGDDATLARCVGLAQGVAGP